MFQIRYQCHLNISEFTIC